MRRIIVSGVLILSAATMSKRARAQNRLPPPADRPPAVASLPPAAPRLIVLRFTLSPEWGYRSFRDREPSSTDKRYAASGIPGANLRLELYPLAPLALAPTLAKNLGLTASYSRAFGLTSKDIDTETIVDTQWYQYSLGLRFRAFGGTNPFSLGVTGGVQRWVFDFDTPATARRPMAIARYTSFSAGVDARYTWRNFSVFGDGRFLLPVTISRLGERKPSQPAFGLSAALGVAFAFSRVFEVEARAAYTMMTFSLPSVPGRSDKHGTVVDEYVVFGAGASLAF